MFFFFTVGYNDIGEYWREELEINNLRSFIQNLWYNFKPYYKKLHAILRNAFKKKYSYNKKEEKLLNGTLPAHILGNMWAQDWSAYFKLLNPFPNVNLDDNFSKANWNVTDMVIKYLKSVEILDFNFFYLLIILFFKVKKADDFYSSLGLNRMTEKFWKYSKFQKTSNLTKCHGSAANMFKKDDFRYNEKIFCC